MGTWADGAAQPPSHNIEDSISKKHGRANVLNAVGYWLTESNSAGLVINVFNLKKAAELARVGDWGCQHRGQLPATRTNPTRMLEGGAVESVAPSLIWCPFVAKCFSVHEHLQRVARSTAAAEFSRSGVVATGLSPAHSRPADQARFYQNPAKALNPAG